MMLTCCNHIRVRLAVFLALVAVASGACSSMTATDATGTVPTAPQEGEGALIPLAVGTHWSYERIDSVEFSSDTSLHSVHSILDFSVIADTTDARGQTWAVMDSSNYVLGDLISGHNYVANLTGGVYELLAPSGIYQAPGAALAFMDFPYPTKRGALFASGIGSVLSTDSVIAAPAGTFHCVVYAALDERVFVAKGVGVILRSLNPTWETSASGTLLMQERVVYRLRGWQAAP